jgi:hypothetical protein
MKSFADRTHRKQRSAAGASVHQLNRQDEESSAASLPAVSPYQFQEKENKTGMPQHLKSGIENLSGYSLDNVRVHYNSSLPAQLKAHAFARGSDIHLAPGQERHLPHEAWHVVQQKQGRVAPTMQRKNGTPVNDDVSLESEADTMGNKALQMMHTGKNAAVVQKQKGNEQNGIVQKVGMEKFMKKGFLLKDYIPSFGMGRFDMELWPKHGLANVIVRLHVTFSNEKVGMGDGPWTNEEKLAWKAKSHESLDKVWNNMAEFSIQSEDWDPVIIKPVFKIRFVDSEDESHVTATAVKVPQPMKKQGIWDIGRNGLMQDQFDKGPMTPTRALLSNIAPEFREDGATGQSHHNIFSHEFGHMIGLPDEYDNETDLGTGPGTRQAGNVELMNKYGLDHPEWAKHTQSLMSDGTQLFKRHFVTVWEALERMTAKLLPGSTVLLTMNEGSPVWMRLEKEERDLDILIRDIMKAEDCKLTMLQLKMGLQFELAYEKARFKDAKGDMAKMADLLHNLPNQRREYIEASFRDKIDKIDWQDEENKSRFNQYMQNFVEVPWTV